MFPVTIYSKPQCPQCDATKRRLTKAGATFREVDLTEQADALAWVSEELGYSSAPVVVIEDGTDENHWSGYRPDLIDRLT